jgi:hypothetical protein
MSNSLLASASVLADETPSVPGPLLPLHHTAFSLRAEKNFDRKEVTK